MRRVILKWNWELCIDQAFTLRLKKTSASRSSGVCVTSHCLKWSCTVCDREGKDVTFIHVIFQNHTWFYGLLAGRWDDWNGIFP